MGQQNFRNWGDQPVLVAIIVLSALLAIPVYVLTLKREVQSSEPSGPPQGTARAGHVISFTCSDPAEDKGQWTWSCGIENASDKAILWNESFQRAGAHLWWVCIGKIECKAVHLDEDLTFANNGNIHFAFLNPREKINFEIRCPDKPIYVLSTEERPVLQL
jgi:hypothetical protein